jgi:hypothetical protein
VEDNLAATFGKGVRLKNITIEMTDEPVTDAEVEKHLPWLKNNPLGYLDGQSSGGGPHLSNILHGGNFKSE